MCVCVCVCVCVCPTKPSFDNDSVVRHGSRAEASLPLTRSAPPVPYDTVLYFAGFFYMVTIRDENAALLCDCFFFTLKKHPLNGHGFKSKPLIQL